MQKVVQCFMPLILDGSPLELGVFFIPNHVSYFATIFNVPLVVISYGIFLSSYFP